MAEALTAFKVVGAVSEGLQGRAQNLNEAAKADAQARLADTQALQRDTAARDELARFLSTVQASRAANGLSANSPNARVLEADTMSRADDDRLRQRADDRQRAANFRAASKSYKSAARMSLFTGAINAGIPIAEYKISKGGS